MHLSQNKSVFIFHEKQMLSVHNTARDLTHHKLDSNLNKYEPMGKILESAYFGYMGDVLCKGLKIKRSIEIFC